jgi:hypothetical protein
MIHADGFCKGRIRLVQSFYGQHRPEVYLECSECGMHIGSIPDVELSDGNASVVEAVQDTRERGPVCQDSH